VPLRTADGCACSCFSLRKRVLVSSSVARLCAPRTSRRPDIASATEMTTDFLNPPCRAPFQVHGVCHPFCGMPTSDDCPSV